jgi:hypothetical protein
MCSNLVALIWQSETDVAPIWQLANESYVTKTEGSGEIANQFILLQIVQEVQKKQGIERQPNYLFYCR